MLNPLPVILATAAAFALAFGLLAERLRSRNLAAAPTYLAQPLRGGVKAARARASGATTNPTLAPGSAAGVEGPASVATRSSGAGKERDDA